MVSLGASAVTPLGAPPVTPLGAPAVTPIAYDHEVDFVMSCDDLFYQTEVYRR